MKLAPLKLIISYLAVSQVTYGLTQSRTSHNEQQAKVRPTSKPPRSSCSSLTNTRSTHPESFKESRLESLSPLRIRIGGIHVTRQRSLRKKADNTL